jgi:hypothetical protein
VAQSLQAATAVEKLPAVPPATRKSLKGTYFSTTKFVLLYKQRGKKVEFVATATPKISEIR